MMKKDTFKIDKYSDGRRFIHQVKKEMDKNHTAKDTAPSNQARIHEQSGTFIFLFCKICCQTAMSKKHY